MWLSMCFWLICASYDMILGEPKSKDINDGKPSSCDMVFKSDNTKGGFFQSPGYPNSYSPKTTCKYKFSGTGKERVQINFLDFNVHHSTDSAQDLKCDTTDSLIAYVPIDGKIEKIDAFCGDAQPRPLMSSGPRLFVDFRTTSQGSSRSAKGFKATYSFIENFGITTGKQDHEYPCAFVFNSSESQNGTFASPNYPGLYPRNTECHYFFNGKAKNEEQGTPGERVQLHFKYFDVEGVLPCDAISASDYVEFSNYVITDRKYPRHCGQLQEFDVTSDWSFFRVTFKSNDRMDGTGFNATYHFFTAEEQNVVKTSENSAALQVGCSLLLLLTFLLVMQFQWLKIQR